MKNNKTDNKVIQVYTNSETHLALSKVSKLERLSCSKLVVRYRKTQKIMINVILALLELFKYLK